MSSRFVETKFFDSLVGSTEIRPLTVKKNFQITRLSNLRGLKYERISPKGSNNNMKNTVKIQEVREKIINDLGVFLGNEFIVKNKKGENYFLKSTPFGYVKIQFFYENYYPLHCCVYFVFSIWQNEIQDIRTKFYLNSNLSFSKTPNVVFFEGDFIPELEEALLKYRQGYKNKISSHEELGRTLTIYKNIFTSLLSIIDNFSSLEKSFMYLSEIKELLVRNCNVNAIETHLILAKLSNPKLYEDILSFYEKKIPTTFKDYGVITSKAMEVVRRLDAYLNNIK